MDAQKVDMFIMANGKYFAEEKISFIRTRLLELDDSKWAQISSLQFKSPTVALSCPSSWDVTALTASISVISAWELPSCLLAAESDSGISSIGFLF